MPSAPAAVSPDEAASRRHWARRWWSCLRIFCLFQALSFWARAGRGAAAAARADAAELCVHPRAVHRWVHAGARSPPPHATAVQSGARRSCVAAALSQPGVGHCAHVIRCYKRGVRAGLPCVSDPWVPARSPPRARAASGLLPRRRRRAPTGTGRSARTAPARPSRPWTRRWSRSRSSRPARSATSPGRLGRPCPIPGGLCGSAWCSLQACGKRRGLGSAQRASCQGLAAALSGSRVVACEHQWQARLASGGKDDSELSAHSPRKLAPNGRRVFADSARAQGTQRLSADADPELHSEREARVGSWRARAGHAAPERGRRPGAVRAGARGPGRAGRGGRGHAAMRARAPAAGAHIRDDCQGAPPPAGAARAAVNPVLEHVVRVCIS